MTFRKKKALLALSAIALLFGSGIGLFYRVVKPTHFQPLAASHASPQSEPEPAEKTQKVDQNANYQIILDRNLFGKSSAAPEMMEQRRNPLAGLPPTSLNITLLGTVFSDTEEKRAIILDNDQKTQEMYHISDPIKGTLIKDILRGAVILKGKNKDEILEMGETKDQAPGMKTDISSRRPQKILPDSEGMEPSRSGNGKTQTAPPPVQRIRTNKKAINE